MPYGPHSSRTTPLPENWRSEIRPRILKRDDYICVWVTNGIRCQERATDVDHIGDPADHRDENLRALCAGHHRKRSSSQGGRAAQEKRIPRKRAPERHPGLI
jgi:hypothetical protein